MTHAHIDYVRGCWLRGRVPERLHCWWHLRRLGRGAWHHTRYLGAPCRVTHSDIEWLEQVQADDSGGGS